MKIGIDASKLVSENPTGVERSTQILLHNLFQLDQDNRYILFTPKALAEEWLRPNVEERIVPEGKFWTMMRLPEYLAKEKLDIFFQPGNILPARVPKKVVMTIHDLAAIRLPRLYPIKEVTLSYLCGLQAARRANKIVAVSESTAEDLKKVFAIPESKIKVIYHGPPRGYLKKVGKTPALAGKNFFLFVGRLELRKNILRLLEAYHIYREKGGTKKLVLAGSPGFGYDKFIKRLKELKTPGVVLLGFVEERTLDGLYAHASALIFPSLYEGFGLPILEAFTYGVPVLTSNFGATKEIASDAALLINPYDINELASGLSRLESDAKLKDLLIRRGKKRLQNFSWVKAARQLLELFRSL